MNSKITIFLLALFLLLANANTLSKRGVTSFVVSYTEGTSCTSTQFYTLNLNECHNTGSGTYIKVQKLSSGDYRIKASGNPWCWGTILKKTFTKTGCYEKSGHSFSIMLVQNNLNDLSDFSKYAIRSPVFSNLFTTDATDLSLVNSATVGSNQEFTIEDNNDGTVSFKTSNNKYLTSPSDTGVIGLADNNNSDNEKFTLQGSTPVTIKSKFNTYMRADPGYNNVNQVAVAQAWEEWQLIGLEESS